MCGSKGRSICDSKGRSICGSKGRSICGVVREAVCVVVREGVCVVLREGICVVGLRYLEHGQYHTSNLAYQVAQLINHAKNLHEEEKYIVRTGRLNKDTIW